MAVIPDGSDPFITLAPHTMGSADPVMRLTRTEFARAMRTPEGPGAVRLRWREGEQVEYWGPGGAWLAAQLPELLGAHDQPPERLASHPVVHDLHRRRRGLRIGANRDPLSTLVAAVCGQRVTGKEARWSWTGLVKATSEPAPGPTGLWLPPDPDRLRTLPGWTYHRCGIDGRRAATIARLGARSRRVAEVCSMTSAEAAARVQAFPGIGPWSSALVQALCMGDPDAVLVGDYGMPDLVCHVLAGESDGTDERMLELLAPFEGQRWRVTRLIELSGQGPSRRAPRARIHDIRRL